MYERWPNDGLGNIKAPKAELITSAAAANRTQARRASNAVTTEDVRQALLSGESSRARLYVCAVCNSFIHMPTAYFSVCYMHECIMHVCTAKYKVHILYAYMLYVYSSCRHRGRQASTAVRRADKVAPALLSHVCCSHARVHRCVQMPAHIHTRALSKWGAFVCACLMVF
jgi:hypothetical protein